MRLANYVYIPNVLTKEECDQIIEEGQNNLSSATIYPKECNSSNLVKEDKDRRKTNVGFFRSGSSVDPALKKAIDVFGRVSFSYYGICLKEIENPQYAEYEKGMFYGWHTDSGMEPNFPVIRDMSASLILNNKNDYTGGSLQMVVPSCISKDNIFTPEDVKNQDQGTLIVFPSSMLHQVTPVLSGVRKSLVIWACSDVKPN